MKRLSTKGLYSPVPSLGDFGESDPVSMRGRDPEGGSVTVLPLSELSVSVSGPESAPEHATMQSAAPIRKDKSLDWYIVPVSGGKYTTNTPMPERLRHPKCCSLHPNCYTRAHLRKLKK